MERRVREASISAPWLGHFFRSFQTGLVRAYALTLAFGVACFALLRRDRSGAMIVTALVLGPIARRACALRAAESARCASALDRHRGRARVRAGCIARRSAADATASVALRARSSRNFISAYGPLSYWIVLLLARCDVQRGARDARAAHARFTALMLLLARHDDRRVPRARSAAVRAVLGSDADPGVLADDRLGQPRAGTPPAPRHGAI